MTYAKDGNFHMYLESLVPIFLFTLTLSTKEVYGPVLKATQVCAVATVILTNRFEL